MENSNKPCRYQPLIATGEKIIRKPILAWQTELLSALVKKVSERDLESFECAVIFNQLALIEAFQGNNASALAICEAQIEYWRNLAESRKRKTLLPPAIQPWINIIRLERWRQCHASSASLYRELAPESRCSRNSLCERYGVGTTLSELIALSEDGQWGNVENVIDYVFWIEYTSLLLVTEDMSKFAAHLKDGLSGDLRGTLKIRLLELWFKSLMMKGSYSYALSSLRRMNLTKNGRFSFNFGVLELVLLVNMCEPSADTIINDLYARVTSGGVISNDSQGLYLLMELTKLYQQFGAREQKITLYKMLSERAVQLDDEVLSFEARLALSELGQYDPIRLQSEFATSRYGIIRSRLGLSKDSDQKRAELIKDGAKQLARLDCERCLQTLGELNVVEA